MNCCSARYIARAHRHDCCTRLQAAVHMCTRADKAGKTAIPNGDLVLNFLDIICVTGGVVACQHKIRA